MSVFRVDSSAYHGSAWKIDENTFASVDHNFSSAGREFFLIGHDGAKHRIGGDVWLDKDSDIAFFTLAPGDSGPAAKPLKTGDTSNFKKGDQLYTIGFAGEPFYPSSTPKVFPGEYKGRHGDLRWSNLRNAIAIGNGAGPGVSGGADVDAQGRVLSMPTGGYWGMQASTAIEKTKDLYQNRDKMQHLTGHYESGWATNYQELFDSNTKGPLSIPLWSASSVAGAALAVRPAVDSAGAVSLRGVMERAPVLAALAGRTYLDVDNLMHSTNARDTAKYSLASVADGVMSVGAGLLFSRFAAAGKIVALSGLAGRLATEFIPNHYVLDETR